jgi:GNAT superfamily N-acetyltransferase
MCYLTINPSNIDNEHICCAISDKKCSNGYNLKKEWLKKEFGNGLVFKRLNERAKVFIEYGPAEKAWVPVTAVNYIMIGCFWVSGLYKEKGHGTALLQEAEQEAKRQGRNGLVTVAGIKKYHFMNDTKWLQKHGFRICDTTPAGFCLLVKTFKEDIPLPRFNETVKTGGCSEKDGYVVYYTNRCPFTEYHVTKSLMETTVKRNITVKIIKLETMEAAQRAPTPATIFSLFHNGKFVTTDISVCMDSRFDRICNSIMHQ